MSNRILGAPGKTKTSFFEGQADANVEGCSLDTATTENEADLLFFVNIHT